MREHGHHSKGVDDYGVRGDGRAMQMKGHQLRVCLPLQLRQRQAQVAVAAPPPVRLHLRACAEPRPTAHRPTPSLHCST